MGLITPDIEESRDVAAKRLGISTTELAYARSWNAPGFLPNGYNVPIIRQWLDRDNNRNKIQMEPKARHALARASLEELKVEKAKFRIALERGDFVPTRQIKERDAKLATDLRNLLRNKLENELPLALEGMAIEERRAELRRVVDDLFVRIGQFSKHWNIDENEQQK